MYCHNCGAENDENAYRCVRCGQVLHHQSPGGPPPLNVQVDNYLVPAILTTAFCCLPFGIVAIVYAAQVNSKLAAGDLAGATASSTSAKNWCLAAFLCGLIPALIWFLIAGLGLVTRMMH